MNCFCLSRWGCRESVSRLRVKKHSLDGLVMMGWAFPVSVRVRMNEMQLVAERD